MTRRRRWRALVVVLVPAALLSGCAGPGPLEDTDGDTGDVVDWSATEGDAPSADDLLAVLPGDPLPGEDWERAAGPTALDEDVAADGGLPLCRETGPAHPLAPILFSSSAEGGAAVRFTDPDESIRLTIVLAPVDGAGDLVTSAQQQVASCSIAAGDLYEDLGWSSVGDASVAFGDRPEAMAPDGPMAGGMRTALVLAHVGDVVVGLRLEAVVDDGSGAGPRLADADLQGVLTDLVLRLEALR